MLTRSNKKSRKKKFLELNGNESTTQQNLWDMLEAALGEKFGGLSAYIKKIRKSTKILNNATLRIKRHNNKPNQNQEDSKR